MRTAYCVAITILAIVGREMLQPEPMAAADPAPRYIYRHQSASLDDPVVGVSGIWTAPPGGRAVLGQAFYAVQVICPQESGPPVHIGIGFIDVPGIREPIIASMCGNCYDHQRGVLPPDGWQVFGNHGYLRGPVEFALNYDVGNGRWAWYVNGQVVRLESSPLVRPGLRVMAGATLDSAAEPARSMWHHNMQVWRAERGAQLFQPTDGMWPETTVASGVVRYDARGTVTVLGEDAPPEWPKDSARDMSTVSGGAAGAVEPLEGQAAFLAGRGTAVELVDVGGHRMSTLASFSSAVTGVSESQAGVFVGLYDGRVVRLDSVADPSITHELQLGAPITVIAGEADAVAAGTASGEVVIVGIELESTVLSRVQLHGRIQDIERLFGRWLVAVETMGYGAPLGRIHEISIDRNGQATEVAAVPLMSSPVAFVPTGVGLAAGIGLASGDIRALDLADGGLVDGGSMIEVPDTVQAVAATADGAYVIGESGDVWVVTIGSDGRFAIVDHVPLHLMGASAAYADQVLVVTTDSGELAAFDVTRSLDEQPILGVQNVGAVVGTVVDHDAFTLLSNHWRLHSVPLDAVPSTVSRTILLPRRGIALRTWGRGLALANGYGGLDLYAEADGDLFQHVGLVGVSSDAVVASDVAYVAAGAAGVHVVEIDDAKQAARAATIATEYLASSVAVSGRMLLVGQMGGDILAFEVSDSVEPRLLGAVAGTPNVIRILARGPHVYALGHLGMSYHLVVEQSGPVRVPAVLRSVRMGRSGFDIGLLEESVLVASGRDGLQLTRLDDEGDFVTAVEIPGDAVLVVGAAGETVVAGLGASGFVRWRESGDCSVYLPFGQDG